MTHLTITQSYCHHSSRYHFIQFCRLVKCTIGITYAVTADKIARWINSFGSVGLSSIFHSYNVVRSGSNSQLTFELARWCWLGDLEKLTNEVIIALDVLLAYICSGVEVERLYAELLSRFLFLMRQPECTKLLK